MKKFFGRNKGYILTVCVCMCMYVWCVCSVFTCVSFCGCVCLSVCTCVHACVYIGHLITVPVLEITVGHWPFSDQFQHLAEQNPFRLAKFTVHFQWDGS